LNLLKTKFGANDLHVSRPVEFRKLTNKNPFSSFDFYWIRKVDGVNLKSCHYTAIIPLNSYIFDYYGGRSTFSNLNSTATTSIYPKKARVILFTSGQENEYFIERVQLGEYYSIFIPFTCETNLAYDF
jgi:hypothetical protein